MIADSKTIEKWRKQDIKFHKKILTTYLHMNGVKSKVVKKLFILYDLAIDEENILSFIHLKSRLFIIALVQNRLDEVSQYTYHRHNEFIMSKINKKRKKCTKNK